jgi:hypothetical protein
VREDLKCFIEDHQEDLRRILREELEALDERLPEEQALIDIHMVALGEELLDAMLSTFKRFLTEEEDELRSGRTKRAGQTGGSIQV